MVLQQFWNPRRNHQFEFQEPSTPFDRVDKPPSYL
jgi:hypothetical protein